MRIAREAERLAFAHEDEAGRAEALVNVGWATIYLGDYDEALAALSTARAVFATLGDRQGLHKATNALGVISFRIGEVEQARELFESALVLCEDPAMPERKLASLNNLGELLASVDEYGQALDYYEQALAIARELDSDAARAVIQVNIASMHRELGSVDESLAEFDEALALAVSIDDRITQAEALTQLGRSVARASDGDDPDRTAEELHLQSVELCEQIGHPAGVVSALEHLASLLLGQGRLDEAEQHIARAVGIARETDAVITAIPLIELLTKRHEESGDIAEAYRLGRWLRELHREHVGADVARRLRTVRAHHEIEQARMEAEIVRLRNVELREKTDALERRNRTLALMNRIGSELTSTMDLDEIARRLHDRVNELMSADVFGFALYREDEQVLDFALVIEDNQRITPFLVPVASTESFGSWVVRNHTEVVLNDAERDYARFITKKRSFTEGRSRSIVYLPLEVDGRIIGVLTVQSHEKNAYDEQQLDALRLLAPYSAIALENSRRIGTIRELNAQLEREKDELERAYERIEHLANHDILTELPNRRLLVELIHEHIPLARRQGNSFALLYVDIDDFKPINDTFGHDAGDMVLARIADRLRGSVRQSDTVARIGGDEFVVVLRSVGGLEDARLTAEKILSSISHPLSVADQIVRLAASIGVSLFPQHGESYDELINAADRAMYRSKQAGKSGISLASGGSYRARTSSEAQTIESPSKTKRPST